LSPESIALECEASLDRLGLDTLDVLQIHRPGGEGDTPLAEAWGVLANLAEAGKVRWLGLSNVSADQVAECHAIRRVDCVQPPFNVFERSNDVANFCAEQGIGVITYSPLGSGILSGSFSMERHASLADGDWRKRHRRFAPSLLERKLEVATQLSGIATDLGCSLPELAIAWVLHQTGVTASIVGARSPSQIDQWIGAADLTLTSDVINQIDRVASELGRAS
jgi:aryl-alcohol dehydrogenase-like predicted oxidoreductase